MKFKKNKENVTIGIKRCNECEQNISCSECAIKGKNEILLEEIEKLKIENQSLRTAANSYKIHYDKARTEAVKEFAESLCKDRVSNDPVVIAVQIELKEWLGDKELNQTKSSVFKSAHTE